MADEGLAMKQLHEREEALRAAERLAQLGSWRWHIGAAAVEWSEQVHRIFGTDPDGPTPTFQTYLEMVHPDDRERVEVAVRAAVRAGNPYDLEHRIVRLDGAVRDIRDRGTAELDSAGVAVWLTGSVQDVTDLNAVANELRRARDLFAGVLDAATEQSIIAIDPDGVTTVFNTGAERMLGYTAAEMIGTSCLRLHDADEIRVRAAELGMEPGFQVFLAGAVVGEPETRLWTYVTRSGQRLQAMITVTAMRGPSGDITGYIKVGTDVTERLRAQAALRESETRFRDTFELAPNGMMLISTAAQTVGNFLGVNAALCRLTGYSREQLTGMSVADLTHPEHQAAHRARFAAFAAGGPHEATAERRWVDADGHDLWVQFHVSPPRSTTESYVIGQVEDITARKLAEARLTRQALHDWLTELPNRVLLMDRISHALAASTRTRGHVGLMYLDLDGFKAVNDTDGHAAGDHLLIEVAHRLRRAVRPGDTVARMGGDEFVVLCEDLTDMDAATRIAERILVALRIPHSRAGQSHTVGASIGVTLSVVGSTPEQLIRDADAAMYAAKHAGKGRIRTSAEDDPAAAERSARAQRTLRIQGELSQALRTGDLVMFGQPIHDLRTGRISAVETLLRWRHPERGLIGPVEFLDAVESSDLMLPIGTRVIDESCRMAATWVDILGRDAPAVHVNISGRQLESPNLSADVMVALERDRLHPRQLVLELTETHMPMLADSVRRQLNELRDQGVRIAIDDLGTGYSSLTRLTELPVDILKIDLRFVAGLVTDPACAAVVHGILAIGNALRLQVIAEGVETADQADQLRTYGCHSAQGYLYHRPLPEAELRSRMQSLVRV